MAERLGGSTVLVVSVETTQEDRFLEPAELQKLDNLHSLLRDMGADEVTSILSYLELTHRELHGGDEAAHRIPDTRAQASQLLLINGDPTVDQYIDGTRRWVRVVARHPEMQISRLVVMFEEIDAFLDEQFPRERGYVAHATGQSRLWSSMFFDLVHSQVASLSISVVAIFLLLLGLFRSLSTGLFATPPNLFPILVVLGFMGWTEMPLNASTVMIATLALGIAVDDTIHFLQHYRSRLRAHGDIERSVRETFRTKGPAIVTTSVVISFGFGVLAVSAFVPTHDFGLLIVAAMAAALVGDLLVLPALLLVTRARLGIVPDPDAQLLPAAAQNRSTGTWQSSHVSISSTYSSWHRGQ
jgi:predicted RND superfamily exporter protein